VIYVIERWNPVTHTWEFVRHANGMPMMYSRKREAQSAERKLRLSDMVSHTRVTKAFD